MSTPMRSRLSSTMWFILIIIVGVGSGWWLEVQPKSQAHQLIVGVYGEAPISVRCPAQGTISELRVRLGQEVNAETLLLTLDAPQDQALLAEVIRERAWAEANIEAQLSSLNHKLKGEELAWRVDQGRAQAQALGVEVDIRRARGQLKTLERSIGSIEAQVKAGSLSLADFTRLKSEISGLKQVAWPLGKQRGALRSVAQIKPEEDIEKLVESWRGVLGRQGEIWRSFEEVTRARLARHTQLYAPFKVQVASQPLPVGSRCLAGEEVMLLQPLTPVVRLWQVSGDLSLKPKAQLNLTLADQRYTHAHLPQRSGTIERIGPSLIPLPDTLQPLARRALMSSALLTLLRGESAPQVRGRPLRVLLLDTDQVWRRAIPWGAVVRVTP